LNELSLFSGAGGGLLGTMLLGFRPIGYVEWDDYCQRVLAARIRDGILPAAPIFGDIKAFISDGYAASYTGMVDVITAGFPCQPFSVAGKQKGADDERNMWPATAECIGIVKPRFVLLENVPGVRKYLPVVVRDLRRLGYEVSRPLILGADDVGAPHRRKRIWIMADSTGNGFNVSKKREGLDERNACCTEGKNQLCESERAGSLWEANVAHSPQRQDDGRERGKLDGTTGGREGIDSPADFGGQVENAQGERLERRSNGEERIDPEGMRFLSPRSGQQIGSWWASDPADTICIYGDDAGHGTGEVCGECESSEICGLSWWGLKSRVGRVVNGCPDRIHRLKALGNMQVASVVKTAWDFLVTY